MAEPRHPLVASLTAQLLRGLAITGVLGGARRATDRLLSDWAAAVQAIVAGAPLDIDQRNS